MAEGTWTCSRCGQIYPMTESGCPVCHITRENRDVIGKVSATRFAAPVAEKVEVPFPFTIKEARFNLPLEKGAVWASGRVMVVEAGFFLISDKDSIDADALAANPPAAAGQVAALSIYVPRAKITRIMHSKLVGEFIELQGKQKIPLRLPPSGWTDLDVLCDQLGIARQ